jgi:hypothetical protein
VKLLDVCFRNFQSIFQFLGNASLGVEEFIFANAKVVELDPIEFTTVPSQRLIAVSLHIGNDRLDRTNQFPVVDRWPLQ